MSAEFQNREPEPTKRTVNPGAEKWLGEVIPGLVFTEDQVNQASKAVGLTNKREREELMEKLTKLGIVKK
ncbi:MAG: hypothetical protein UT58_C0008G0003 [Microgenomates group bacterium GW2011_GWC1_39_7b]|uniref:Uncharacterized protein n=3 Tax=Candidatus Woeseibacteriota TaxID=1752722 RepID=A0A0G0UUP3_9BACT|nr:MAG: hypothetical protein UT17_C0002G0165 [Candidatus Woesebacteria bacterium GW2011_GWB1_39_10]KKR26678.1 MAG: hypothetical protein UT58_C0008G0003 [Microgenomates group bacterium GW2011_GWC1_39_7b]KKR74185.1 MAG: hypothetical protein UU16_C0004G0009 [Candidatus Woesebacteria bacterium GW2011_GWA2_40_7]KKR92484.1 MAG: hypothetical protein UU42_C0001G0088 [Candidatus Woesebacteria bacterium GW2011_GWA1_41_13b]